MDRAEFLLRFEDVGMKRAIEGSIEVGERCLRLNHEQWRLTSEVPEIEIADNDDINAYSSFDYNKIFIAAGLIDFYLRARVPDIKGFVQVPATLASHKNAVAVGILWSILHEYHHIVRWHDVVIQSIIEASTGDPALVSIEKRAALSLSVGDIHRAFEYDADLCAIASIYRDFQSRFRDVLDDMVIRKMVNFYIYWAIREFPDSGGAGDHPALSERLYDIGLKLAQIPGAEFDGDLVDFQTSPEMVERCRELSSFAMALESYYIDVAGGDPEKALWFGWMEKIENGTDSKKALDWQKIAPWVEEMSKIRAII